MAANPEDIRILIDKPCATCEGDGVVFDPENFGWHEANAITDEGEYKKWLGEKGYIPDLLDLLDRVRYLRDCRS